MANHTGRRAQSRRDSGSAGPWIAAAFVAVAAVAGIFIYSMKEAPDKRGDGCLGDGDCKAGFLCADGGCVPLISDEIPEVWHEGVNAQTDPEKGTFSPRPAYGVKLIEPKICPGKKVKNIKNKRRGAITHIYEMTVLALSLDHLKIIKQMKFKSSMWLETIKFRIPRVGVEGAPVICHGEELDGVQVNRGKTETVVEGVLSQAIPAGAETEASVMERRFLSKEERERGARISFSMNPLRNTDKKQVTVFAVPLGAEIVSMEGPPPSKQRLLTGYIAYYFDHAERRQQVTVKVKVPKRLRAELVLEEVKP